MSQIQCSACQSPATLDETRKFQCLSPSCPNRQHYPEVNLEERARNLLQEGYRPVSRHLCIVARAPNLEELSQARLEFYKQFEDYYFRVYATDRLTLEPELFEEFCRQSDQAV